MARYRVSITVYKDPAGKTMMGPTALHFLGDIFSGLGLIGALGVIVAFIEHHDMTFTIVCAVLGVVGFALMAVIHKQAKKSAEAKYLQVLAQQKGQTITQNKD
ncbi:MAG: hypothetical protein K2M42_03930 [Oscillospiraceae bacterium]|nr:hypothetical protein [Oscillospiraceae bacterium]